MIPLKYRLHVFWHILDNFFDNASHLRLKSQLLVPITQLLVQLLFVDFGAFGLGLLFVDLGLHVVIVQFDVLLHYCLEVTDHCLDVLGQLELEVGF